MCSSQDAKLGCSAASGRCLWLTAEDDITVQMVGSHACNFLLQKTSSTAAAWAAADNPGIVCDATGY
jgi:hypothetical protein